ncbi:haloacid dehalogenase-like hydrolase [Eubacteriales bacterium mix99]
MVRRFISASASEIAAMQAQELKQSIKASEGRVIVSENVCSVPTLTDVTNSEVAVAYGADMILLNAFDALHPYIEGIEKDVENPIAVLKRYIGRPVGVNLEPVDPGSTLLSEKEEILEGRISSVSTFEACEKLGVDFICLTGNPGTGVTNREIAKAVRVAKQHFSGLIIAGKMHSAGSDEPVVTMEVVESYAEAGANVLLLPSVGTIQGFTQENLMEAVRLAKKHDLLTMSAIGTSQEGARVETIRQMAIANKICGVDMQHIGDAGFAGVALPENIYEMSIAIRGIRHTISRISRSINR